MKLKYLKTLNLLMNRGSLDESKKNAGIKII